ncbi:hypothetical protein SLEP1_g10611 [Rubroshorea leprosula]|uniref:Uncharacterized protein n=1 Tax=Rubroshorea leprosula TaxID=152421 RepID=A0AAV5IEI5_9ROSI|nr:hypothetical protein SLEP1_g10611 [Rubroshorea leprosula]
MDTSMSPGSARTLDLKQKGLATGIHRCARRKRNI